MKEENSLKAEYGSNKTPLKLGDLEIPCYVLEDGRRVLSGRGIDKILSNDSDNNLPVITTRHFFKSAKFTELFDKKLVNKLKNPLKFYQSNGLNTNGYEATLFIDLCNNFIDLFEQNKIGKEFKNVVKNCLIIVRAVSKVGIVALIDEATGYQYDRKYDALRILLEQYIQEEARKWIKEFPNEFFTQLDKLYNNPKTTSRNRPMYYGKFINEYIYKPLENVKVLTELKEINPTIKNKKGKGHRKNRHHQHMTEKIGLNQLRAQIFITLGLMRVATSIKKFKELFNRSNSNQLTLFGD